MTTEPQWLREGLVDLAEQVDVRADLRDQALATSRRLGIRRTAVVCAAAAAVVVLSVTSALALTPNRAAPDPQPAVTPNAPSVPPSESPMPSEPPLPSESPVPSQPPSSHQAAGLTDPDEGAAGTSSGPPQRCRTADLILTTKYLPPAPDGAGSERTAALILTNGGTAACTRRGYPRIQLLDGAGKDLPTDPERVASEPGLVTLAPREAAYAVIAWRNIPAADEEECSAPEKIRVTPPDEARTLVAPVTIANHCLHGKTYVSALSTRRPW